MQDQERKPLMPNTGHGLIASAGRKRLDSLPHTKFHWPLVIIDFEATALTLESFPIEVGLAWATSPTAPVEIWSTLICPDPSWDIASQWDPDAEKIHGISRWQLRNGMTALDAMTAINRLTQSVTHVWCDGGHYDRHWLQTLSQAADVVPRFELGDITALIEPDQALQDRYRLALSQSKAPHRAGPDAARICHALFEVRSG